MSRSRLWSRVVIGFLKSGCGVQNLFLDIQMPRNSDYAVFPASPLQDFLKESRVTPFSVGLNSQIRCQHAGIHLEEIRQCPNQCFAERFLACQDF